jgi:hypothetical protein
VCPDHLSASISSFDLGQTNERSVELDIPGFKIVDALDSMAAAAKAVDFIHAAKSDVDEGQSAHRQAVA